MATNRMVSSGLIVLQGHQNNVYTWVSNMLKKQDSSNVLIVTMQLNCFESNVVVVERCLATSALINHIYDFWFFFLLFVCFVCFRSFSFAQWCFWLFVVHSWLHLRFSLTFIDITRFYCTFLIWRPIYRQPIYVGIYPAMTTFTDQYSLPNIFFDIGQL
jgi:hypothetical protein